MTFEKTEFRLPRNDSVIIDYENFQKYIQRPFHQNFQFQIDTDQSFT